MKIRYKILIIIVIIIFIYWPVLPLVALSCQELTNDEICFEIARLRIPISIPDNNWQTIDNLEQK